MRSYSVQRRMTQIPAHLKNKQAYCISKTKELCNQFCNKPSDKLYINVDDRILKLMMSDEFTKMLKGLDKHNKKLIIEEIQNQKQMDVAVLNIKDENSIQNIAIKLINASLSELGKLEKLIVFIG